MSYVLRQSKYRHVFGQPSKEINYGGCKSVYNTPEGLGLAGNSKFFCYSMTGGGGRLAIHDFANHGRQTKPGFLTGHTGTILDFDWNPFDDFQIATGSEDLSVKVFQLPEDGIEGGTSFSEDACTLLGHQKKVNIVQYHPTAEGILTSAAHDGTIRVWDISKGETIATLQNPELTHSIAWNYDGSLFAASCKPEKVHRIFDPRKSGGEAVQTLEAFAGSKPQRLVWMGKHDKIVATGFGRQSERLLAVHDPRNTSKPVYQEKLDTGAGVLMPMYDEDTGVLFVAGKGDASIRYFEFQPDVEPFMHSLSVTAFSGGQKAVCMLPKMACNYMGCEIARILRLNGETVETVQMIVPRKGTDFQADIFPDTASPEPSMTGEEWIGGANKAPILQPVQSDADKPKKKVVKSAMQLQRELADKDKIIEDLQKKVAQLEARLK